MMTKFLVRGMLAGILAGLLSFGFAKVFGEPSVDKAIAFESQMDKLESKEGGLEQASRHVQEAAGLPVCKTACACGELVSRRIQGGWGLFTAIVTYGSAIGGLFALAFSVAYGRVGNFGPRAIAMLLAGAGFFTIVLIPTLKYPANPPAVGLAETIGMRTSSYFGMILFSISIFALSVVLGTSLVKCIGAWNATILAGMAFVGMIGTVMFLLPSINEVPELFPAVVLWRFRIASLGTQCVLWTTLGLLFGAFTERSLRSAYSR